MDKNLVRKLLERVYLIDRPNRLRWAKRTGQSMQPDSGAFGEHLVSLVSGIPGKGSKGKGVDLSDNNNPLFCSEIKTGSKLDQRGSKHDGHPKQQPFKELHLKSWPKKKHIYIVMIDDPYLKKEDEQINIVRIRIWDINPKNKYFLETIRRNWRNKTPKIQKKGFTLNLRPGKDKRWPLKHVANWQIDGNISPKFNPPKIFEGIVYLNSKKIILK